MRPFCFRPSFALGAVLALIAALLPGSALALPFSSSVLRFEADGNNFGSADGVFDLVDEFDTGMLAPNWSVLLGTALESGSKLTVRDPGVSVALITLLSEISTVESAVALGNGDGNFTITSYWDPIPLPTNRQFFFQIYGELPTVEAHGLLVSNLDAAHAAVAGAPVGLSIARERVFPLGAQVPPVYDYVAINPADVTGPIVLRMSFDDASDLLTCSFSLDGGATFQSPFAPLQAFVLNPDGEILLGAAALPDLPPPPPPCAGTITNARVQFQKLNRPPGQQDVRFTVRMTLPPTTAPTYNPLDNGVTLIALSGNTPPEFEQFAVPPGAFTCGFSDGWFLKGHNYVYLNESGIIPPTCGGNSANGLAMVKFRDDRARKGAVKFVLTAKHTFILTPAQGSPPGILVFLSGQIADAIGSGACAQAPLTCKSSASTVNCTR